VWGLRAYGVSGAEVANGMVCFGVLSYGVYAAAVAIARFGLWFGLFSGPGAAGLTLVPATLTARSGARHGYYVGTAANVLPLPGGIGGVRQG